MACFTRIKGCVQVCRIELFCALNSRSVWKHFHPFLLLCGKRVLCSETLSFSVCPFYLSIASGYKLLVFLRTNMLVGGGSFILRLNIQWGWHGFERNDTVITLKRMCFLWRKKKNPEQKSCDSAVNMTCSLSVVVFLCFSFSKPCSRDSLRSET